MGPKGTICDHRGQYRTKEDHRGPYRNTLYHKGPYGTIPKRNDMAQAYLTVVVLVLLSKSNFTELKTNNARCYKSPINYLTRILNNEK